MMAMILAGLIAVTQAGTGHAGDMQQGQTQGIVVGFVPAVLAVAEDRHPVTVVRSGQVGPLLRVDLIRGIGVVGALYTADADVVGCLGVAGSQRKFVFQQAVARIPVQFGHDIDAVGLFAFIQLNPLGDF